MNALPRLPLAPPSRRSRRSGSRPLSAAPTQLPQRSPQPRSLQSRPSPQLQPSQRSPQLQPSQRSRPARPSSLSSPSLQPSPSPQHASQRRIRPRRSSNQAIAAEAGVKLVVNMLLGLIAVAALARLVPYNVAQEDSLQELQVKVAEMDRRVAKLRTDLNYNFDPAQAVNVMQEQSTWSDPNQRQVVFLKPNQPVAQEQSTNAGETSETAADSIVTEERSNPVEMTDPSVQFEVETAADEENNSSAEAMYPANNAQ